MKKVILIIVLLGIIGVGWFLISPLFINQTVEEALPITSSFSEEEAKAIVALDEEESSIADQNTEVELKEETNPYQDIINSSIVTEITNNNDEVKKSEPANDIILNADVSVKEEMPDMEPDMSIETRGSFVGADRSHLGSGELKVIKDGGKTFLRFESFSVTNGPDLFVTLNKGDSPKGEHVTIQKLKGNKGAQNYDVSDYNLDEYGSVSIYCRAFSVEFATASL